jgi:hypothetical protein
MLGLKGSCETKCNIRVDADIELGNRATRIVTLLSGDDRVREFVDDERVV